MGRESYELGKNGEELACKYLLQKGFVIIERNFRAQQGEIDIIAKEKDCMVFVEVKSYSYRSFYPPIYAITKDKKGSIIRAAKYYVYKKKLYHELSRFDLVAIYQKPNGEMVFEHIKMLLE